MTAVTLPVAVEAPQHSGLTGALHYSSPQALPPGTLLRVPLGKRELTGVVWHRAEGSAATDAQLRPLTEVLDAIAPLPAAILPQSMCKVGRGDDMAGLIPEARCTATPDPTRGDDPARSVRPGS